MHRDRGMLGALKVRHEIALRYAAFVVLPLVAGAAIYVLLRPTAPSFVSWLLDLPTVGGWLARARGVGVRWGLGSPILRVLPDLAWAFALGGLLALLWRNGPTRPRRIWCAIGAVAALGYELAQSWHWVPGTFDPFDLMAQAMGYAMGFIGATWRRGGRARDVTIASH